MLFVRSTASKRRACVVAVIFLLGEIMPMCSRYVKKKLVYIANMAISGCQPFSCFKCTKSNICSSCDVRLVFNAEYACVTRLYNLRSLRLLYLIYYRVSRLVGSGKA